MTKLHKTWQKYNIILSVYVCDITQKGIPNNFWGCDFLKWVLLYYFHYLPFFFCWIQNVRNERHFISLSRRNAWRCALHILNFVNVLAWEIKMQKIAKITAVSTITHSIIVATRKKCINCIISVLYVRERERVCVYIHHKTTKIGVLKNKLNCDR